MMKAKYLGTEDGPRSVGFADLTFPKGVFVDISKVPAPLVARLSANRYFEVSKEPMTKPEAEKAVAAVKAVEPAPKVDAPKADEKDGVIAKLTALKVTIDPKASLTELKAALEDAEFAAGEDA